MAIHVRIMKKKDIPRVQYVAKTSWHATYQGIIPRHIQDSFLQNAYSRDSMKRRLKHSHIFVAEMDMEIVGFANFSMVDQDGKAELGAIYLLPEFQGIGIGTALLNEGLKKLPGIRKIHLRVEKHNVRAKRFYESKGFKAVTEMEEDFNGHMLTTVWMVWNVRKSAE